MTDLTKTIGANLNRIRRKKELSRRDLSTQLGIPERDLEGIEKGTKNFDANIVSTITEILGIEPSDLLVSESNKDKLIHLIKSRLDSCSEYNLISILKYIDMILEK